MGIIGSEGDNSVIGVVVECLAAKLERARIIFRGEIVEIHTKQRISGESLIAGFVFAGTGIVNPGKFYLKQYIIMVLAFMRHGRGV